MSRLSSIALGASILGTLLPLSSWGQAVSVDAASLMRRLDIMEQRIKSVEGQRASSSRLQPMVSAGGGATATSYSLTDLDQRMGELERDMNQQTGGNERLQFALEKLAKQFDDFSKDIDLRLSDIEGRITKIEARSQSAAAVPAPVASPSPVVASGTPAAVVAGTPVNAAAPAAGTGQHNSSSTSIIPAGMSAAAMYNKAYAFLTATDYPNTRLWLEEFLKRYPTDKLADNAWYWQGEVQLVQNNPSGAVVSFRNGLKYFPRGAKAPANLLKMGIALEQLNQPELAKGAWNKLLKEYPNSPEAARAKEKLLGPKPAA